MILRICDFGHSKLGAIKSTLPETFAGLPMDAITQSGFEFDPVNEKSLYRFVPGQPPYALT